MSARYYLSHSAVATLRAHATTKAQHETLDRLEALDGDASDVERALVLCVRAGDAQIAEALGHAAPDVAQRIAEQLKRSELPETPSSATVLRVTGAMLDGAIRKLEAPPPMAS